MRPPSLASGVAFLVMAFLVVTAFPSKALAQNTHPQVGVWKLNVAKSKYDPGPAPKSSTRTYEQNGDGLKDTLETVNAAGSLTKQSWVAHFDGKDNPFVGGPADTIAIKRIDASTWEASLSQGGKVQQTNRNTISKDGKTTTVTVKGTTADGKPVSNTLVFDKQ